MGNQPRPSEKAIEYCSDMKKCPHYTLYECGLWKRDCLRDYQEPLSDLIINDDDDEDTSERKHRMRRCENLFKECEGTFDECDSERKTCLAAIQDYN